MSGLKKLLIGICSCVMAGTMSLGLAACGEDKEESSKNGVSGISSSTIFDSGTTTPITSSVDGGSSADGNSSAIINSSVADSSVVSGNDENSSVGGNSSSDSSIVVDSRVGVYTFSSMRFMNSTYNVGDTMGGGIVLTEDSFILILRDDGTADCGDGDWVYTTWTNTEITLQGDTHPLLFEGSSLTWDMSEDLAGLGIEYKIIFNKSNREIPAAFCYECESTGADVKVYADSACRLCDACYEVNNCAECDEIDFTNQKRTEYGNAVLCDNCFVERLCGVYKFSSFTDGNQTIDVGDTVGQWTYTEDFYEVIVRSDGAAEFLELGEGFWEPMPWTIADGSFGWDDELIEPFKDPDLVLKVTVSGDELAYQIDNYIFNFVKSNERIPNPICYKCAEGNEATYHLEFLAYVCDNCYDELTNNDSSSSSDSSSNHNSSWEDSSWYDSTSDWWGDSSWEENSSAWWDDSSWEENSSAWCEDSSWEESASDWWDDSSWEESASDWWDDSGDVVLPEQRYICSYCGYEFFMDGGYIMEDGTFYCYSCYEGYINGGALVCIGCNEMQGTQNVDGVWYCDYCYNAHYGDKLCVQCKENPWWSYEPGYGYICEKCYEIYIGGGYEDREACMNCHNSVWETYYNGMQVCYDCYNQLMGNGEELPEQSLFGSYLLTRYEKNEESYLPTEEYYLILRSDYYAEICTLSAIGMGFCGEYNWADGDPQIHFNFYDPYTQLVAYYNGEGVFTIATKGAYDYTVVEFTYLGAEIPESRCFTCGNFNAIMHYGTPYYFCDACYENKMASCERCQMNPVEYYYHSTGALCYACYEEYCNNYDGEDVVEPEIPMGDFYGTYQSVWMEEQSGEPDQKVDYTGQMTLIVRHDGFSELVGWGAGRNYIYEDWMQIDFTQFSPVEKILVEYYDGCVQLWIDGEFRTAIGFELISEEYSEPTCNNCGCTDTVRCRLDDEWSVSQYYCDACYAAAVACCSVCKSEDCYNWYGFTGMLCYKCYEEYLNSSSGESDKVWCSYCSNEFSVDNGYWMEDGTFYCYGCYEGYINGGAGYPDTPEVSEKEEIIEEVASATC